MWRVPIHVEIVVLEVLHEATRHLPRLLDFARHLDHRVRLACLLQIFESSSQPDLLYYPRAQSKGLGFIQQ